jgi:acetyl esterase/lipase
MSSDVFAAMQGLGTELTPALIQGTQALFAPLVARPTASICKVERDITYGPDPRHRLDVFHPVMSGSSRPVVAFVHGGGFVAGDKGGPEAPFYNNVGAWAVQHGMIGVTLTYRLAPAARWPAGAQDLAGALGWLGANIARFGGDPTRIFLMGQSAGGAHVAGYLAGHGKLGAQAAAREGAGAHANLPPLAGAMLVSGVYDLLTLRHSPYEEAYFDSNPATYAARSSLEGLVRTEVPCLFVVAELDSAVFQQQAARVVDAHRAAKGGVWPRMLYLQGHNHLSPVLQLSTEVDTLGPELVRFIRRFAGKEG